MEEEDKCRGCGRIFKSILGHIARSTDDCKKKYTAVELSAMQKQSKESTLSKKNFKRQACYDPVVRATKHGETYNSIKRKEKYKASINEDTKKIKKHGFHQHQLCKGCDQIFLSINGHLRHAQSCKEKYSAEDKAFIKKEKQEITEAKKFSKRFDVSEDLEKCKVCKKYFLSILAHLSKVKCSDEYSREEIEELKKDKRRKTHSKHNKQKAEKQKQSYDPKARRHQYQMYKIKEGLKKDQVKLLRKASDRNRQVYHHEIRFHYQNEDMHNLKRKGGNQELMDALKHEQAEAFTQLEDDLDEIQKKVGKMSKEESNQIFKDYNIKAEKVWHDLKLKSESTLKVIAEQIGKTYRFHFCNGHMPNTCNCEECKSLNPG